MFQRKWQQNFNLWIHLFVTWKHIKLRYVLQYVLCSASWYGLLINFFFFLAFGFRTEELNAYSVMVQGMCWWRSMLLNLVRAVVMKVVLKSIGLCGESKNLKSSSFSKLVYKVNWQDSFCFFISIQSCIAHLHFTSPVYVNF